MTSRIPGFYDLPLAKRVETIVERNGISRETVNHLHKGGGLTPAAADLMSENVVAVHGLPLSLGLNFVINGNAYLVPMATEEPSVVAAASHAAKLVLECGGFSASADASIMTAQVQLCEVEQQEPATAAINAHKSELLALGDEAIPAMVERGGGCRDLEARALAEGIFVVDMFVDVGNAMGANTVDTVAEHIAPRIQELVGGKIGLRILSNLSLRRMVRVSAEVPAELLGGRAGAKAISQASRFAELDPMRAATHNKGIMNGVDAVAVALGQDWRAIEAGAHAYAAHSGSYSPLSRWWCEGEGDDLRLCGHLKMPMAVGVVGGSTKVHPGVVAAFDVLKVGSAQELATVVASVGLASNLAALKALASEGIQKGHMRLHQRRHQGKQ